MHANTSGWIRCKAARVLLWMVAGVTAGLLAIPQRASAMPVPMTGIQTQADVGFAIVFDLDFVDNVLRVTLPKSGGDVLTLSHPLDVLESVVVDFVPERGVRVSFGSESIDVGGGGPSSPGNGGSVPEPASGALLGLGLLAAWARRRCASRAAL